MGHLIYLGTILSLMGTKDVTRHCKMKNTFTMGHLGTAELRYLEDKMRMGMILLHSKKILLQSFLTLLNHLRLSTESHFSPTLQPIHTQCHFLARSLQHSPPARPVL